MKIKSMDEYLIIQCELPNSNNMGIERKRTEFVLPLVYPRVTGPIRTDTPDKMFE